MLGRRRGAARPDGASVQTGGRAETTHDSHEDVSREAAPVAHRDASPDTRATATRATTQYALVRGGLSFWGVLTGVLVAFGAMFIFGAIIAGILVAMGMDDGVTRTEAIQAGVGGAVAIVVAQFLAYLWGGYTAGRMSRGAGMLNGFFVPVVAILLGVGVGALAGALGAEARLNLPFDDFRFAVAGDMLVNLGIGVGVGSLIAMLLGGILGGIRGAHWHDRLEDRQLVGPEVDRRRVAA